MSRHFEPGKYGSRKFIGYGPSSIPVGLERLHVQMRDLGVLEALVEKTRREVFTEHRAAQI